jgi:hypothetical protein
MQKSFSVKSFTWEDSPDKIVKIRKVVELGKGLTWQAAKELRKEHKGAWIV